MTNIKNDYPVENALCVFRSGKIFFLGYISFRPWTRIKLYGKPLTMPIAEDMQYQYVLNEQGGYIFINGKEES